MIDDHDACYKEMKRIDQEWRERYDQKHTVRQVLEETPDGYNVLQITKIYWSDAGMMVYVR